MNLKKLADELDIWEKETGRKIRYTENDKWSNNIMVELNKLDSRMVKLLNE